MPWGWTAPTGDLSVSVGGNVGTWQESKQTNSWPEQEADYLKRRMQRGAVDRADKYNIYELPEDYRQPYLDKVSENYKTEANEQLKMEFNQWLQGTHPSNQTPMIYPNRQGQTKRVYLKPETNAFGRRFEVGDQKDDFNVTPWGMQGLTQLEGVREYLRSQKEKAAQNDFALNVLAEEGPQNLEEAWQYFKTWVKGRPQSEGALDLGFEYNKGPFGGPSNLPRDPRNTKRSDFGNKQPDRTVGYPLTDTDFGRELLSQPEYIQRAATVQNVREQVRQDLERAQAEAEYRDNDIQRQQTQMNEGMEFQLGLLREPVNWSPEVKGEYVFQADTPVFEAATDTVEASADVLRAVDETVQALRTETENVVENAAADPNQSALNTEIQVREQQIDNIQANIDTTLNNLADELEPSTSRRFDTYSGTPSLTPVERRVSFAEQPSTSTPRTRQNQAGRRARIEQLGLQLPPPTARRATRSPGGTTVGTYADFDPNLAVQR